MVFEAAVLTFPLVLGINGVWFSTVATEVVAALLTAFFRVTKAEKYGY